MGKKNKNENFDYDPASFDEFQAYGMYSYSYQHQPDEMEQEQEFLQPEYMPPPPPPPPPRKRRSLLSSLVILLIFLAAGAILLPSVVFRLEAVTVEGNTTKSARYIVALSGLSKGDNIFSVSERTIRANLSSDPSIEFLYMHREGLNTLCLYIRERQPAATLKANGIQYFLDDTGFVLSESVKIESVPGIPEIKNLETSYVRAGQMLDVSNSRQMEAFRAIMTELSLQMYCANVTEVNLRDPDNIFLTTVEGITARLGDYTYPRAKIGAIRTDVARLAELEQTFGILDVSIPEDAKYTPH